MSESEAPVRVDAAQMREIVFHDHSDVRAKFQSALGGQIDAVILPLATSYAYYQELEASLTRAERGDTALMFLHVAHNSIITALHLLISGFLAPSGNSMRQFAEATAMALLCVEPSNGTFEEYERLGNRYPFQKALDRVAKEKVRKKLRVDRTSWQQFIDTTSFYHGLSHASNLTLAANILFDRPGVVVLAGEFDSGKVDLYAIELRRMLSAVGALSSAMGIVREHMQVGA